MGFAYLRRFVRKEFDGWWVISLWWAAVILLPFLFIFASWFREPNENWLQIKAYLLKEYTANTLWLVASTGLFSAFLGVSLAWLIAAYEFPLGRFFRWALALPLAIPPYIGAYTYSAMLSYTGVVQTTLRNEFGYAVPPHWFDLGSIKGAIFVFVLFLYPYVYLISRTFLESHSASYVENARLLGRRPLSVFFRIVIPLSRPAIVGGVVLVVYEVLGDYGVTSYFGVRTVTTAIFQTWFGMYDVGSAMRLAAWLMVIAVGVFILERLLRQGRMYHLGTQSRAMAKIRLKGKNAALAVATCFAVFALGFLIPVVQLIAWSGLTFDSVWSPSFWKTTVQTVGVAGGSTLIILAFSLVVANVCRKRSAFTYALSKWTTSGYAVPGAIIAIGILALFIWLDGLLAPLYAAMGLGKNPLVLSMSLTMLVFGYAVRFMATGYNALEAGFEKIGTKYAEAARMLNHGATVSFFKVDLPLLKGALLSGFILTFVEICKELPLALLLRPFNFETLATKTYQYAKDEQVMEGATPSLMIIAVSLLAVLMLHVAGRRSK